MNCPTCRAANAAGATTCATCGTALRQVAPANGAAPGTGVTTGAAVPYSPSLASNTRLQNGAYAVREVLGQGGFGITYKGGDMKLRRYVAIKEFFPYGAQRQGTTVFPPNGTTADAFTIARKGFVREAMTLAKFNHPGIVRVFGAFEENNTAYMVMELLEGKSLQQLLTEKTVIAEKDAVRIITQTGEALIAVHESRLLHRDIKPDNIVLVAPGTPEQRAVLIDFGTAREFAADKTRAMTAMVTHGYAPLEQYGTEAKFGPYTDIYALGATLYHCLTGQAPGSAMDRLAGVELLSPERVNPNIGRAISDAVMWALQIKATDRPQTIQQWLQALTATSSPAPRQSVPQVTPTFPPQAQPAPPTPYAPWSEPAAPPPPNTLPQSRTCAQCNAPLRANSTVCELCYATNEPASGSTRSQGAVVVGSLLVVILLGAALFGRRGESPYPPNRPVAQLTPEPWATIPMATPTAVPVHTPRPFSPSPVRPFSPAPVTMTSQDAYEAACESVGKQLKRPYSADYLSYYSQYCHVSATGANSWQIESAGSARDMDGDEFLFKWTASIQYFQSSGEWYCNSTITDVKY